MGAECSQYYSVKEAAYAQVPIDDGVDDFFTSLFRRLIIPNYGCALACGNFNCGIYSEHYGERLAHAIHHTFANDRAFPNPGSKISNRHIRADPDHCGHQYDHTGPNRHVIPSRSRVYVCGYLGEQDLLGKL